MSEGEDQGLGATAPGKTGLLLIHGMGEQRRGSVLVDSGDFVVEWLRARYGESAVDLQYAEIDPLDGGAQAPAHALLVVAEQAQILIAESRWSDSFRPVKFGRLLPWTLRAMMLSVFNEVSLIRRNVGAEDNRATRPVFSKTAGWTSAALRISLLIAALPLALILLLALYVLALIPRARLLVLRAQSVLSGTLGDGFVFVENLTSGVAIVTHVRRDVAWLMNQGCDRIVVAAHSQGAAIALEALTFELDGADLPLTRRENTEQPSASPGSADEAPSKPPAQTPVELVTFGAGTQKLNYLKEHEGPIPWRLAARLVGILLLSAVAVAWLVALGDVMVVLGQEHVKIVLICTGGFWLLPGLAWVVNSVWLQNKRSLVPVAVLLYAIFLALWVYLWTPVNDNPFIGGGGGMNLLWIIFAISGFAIVSRLTTPLIAIEESKPTISAPTRTLNVHSWRDVRASSDLVATSPSTGYATQSGTYPCDQEVHNLRSILFDHTSYWDNWAEFVPLIANLCLSGSSPLATTSQSATLNARRGKDESASEAANRQMQPPNRLSDTNRTSPGEYVRGLLPAPAFWLTREASRRHDLTYVLVSFRFVLTGIALAAVLWMLSDLQGFGHQVLSRIETVVNKIPGNNVKVPQDSFVEWATGLVALIVTFSVAYWLVAAVWHWFQLRSRRERVGILQQVEEFQIGQSLNDEVVEAVRARFQPKSAYLFSTQTRAYLWEREGDDAEVFDPMCMNGRQMGVHVFPFPRVTIQIRGEAQPRTIRFLDFRIGGELRKLANAHKCAHCARTQTAQA